MSNHSEQDSQDLSSQDNTQKPTTRPRHDGDGFEDDGCAPIYIEEPKRLPLPNILTNKRQSLPVYALGTLMAVVLAVGFLAGAYTLLVAKPVPESYNHPGYLGTPPILPVPMPKVTPEDGGGATPMPQPPVPDANAL